MVDTAQLTKIRRAIVARGDKLEALLAEPSFTRSSASSRARRTRSCRSSSSRTWRARPLLLNKMFFYAARLPPEFILEPDLAEKLMDYFRAGWPVSTFFARALA
jgi:hypothetical protein